MKVKIISGSSSHFRENRVYTAYEFFSSVYDTNLLSSNGLIVIDDDGDAISSLDANTLWGVVFEIVEY